MKKSAEASDHQDQNSVYDFIYYDARRVASFLAQLDPQGHLQSLKASAQTGRTTSSSVSGEAGIGASFIGNLKGGLADVEGEQYSRASEKTYDPFWANALALLDHLTRRDLINREIGRTGIGQFVLLTGNLDVLNLGVLSSIWKSSAARGIADLNVEGANILKSLEAALSLDIVASLPHLVQSRIFVEEPFSASWMFLDEQSLVIPASTIVLNYGVRVPGTWSVLGFLDSLPSAPIEPDAELAAAVASDLQQAARDRHSTVMCLLAELLSPAARQMMGRPGAYYGVTPLLIFREVTGAAPAPE